MIVDSLRCKTDIVVRLKGDSSPCLNGEFLGFWLVFLPLESCLPCAGHRPNHPLTSHME